MTNKEALGIVDECIVRGGITKEAENYTFWETIRFALEKQVSNRADVKPAVHGHWIKHCPNVFEMYGSCSVCGFEQSISHYLNYCPNCGADMRGDKDDE